MKFELSNEEIVYLHDYLGDSLKAMDTDMRKRIEFMEEHLSLYKRLYGDSEDFNEEDFDLQNKLLQSIRKDSLEDKVQLLEKLVGKLNPIFELIEESDGDFVREVREKYLEPSKESQDILNQLKNRRHQDEQD